jgi:hypothetical protein
VNLVGRSVGNVAIPARRARALLSLLQLLMELLWVE